MLRHKKEMKQHRLAKFHKKQEELMQRYRLKKFPISLNLNGMI